MEDAKHIDEQDIEHKWNTESYSQCLNRFMYFETILKQIMKKQNNSQKLKTNSSLFIKIIGLNYT